MVKNVAVLRAVDWGIYSEQEPARTKFEIVRGFIVGFCIDEDDEKIVLAPQLFEDGGTRCTLVVPKVCVLQRFNIEAQE